MMMMMMLSKYRCETVFVSSFLLPPLQESDDAATCRVHSDAVEAWCAQNSLQPLQVDRSGCRGMLLSRLPYTNRRCLLFSLSALSVCRGSEVTVTSLKSQKSGFY